MFALITLKSGAQFVVEVDDIQFDDGIPGILARQVKWKSPANASPRLRFLDPDSVAAIAMHENDPTAVNFDLTPPGVVRS